MMPTIFSTSTTAAEIHMYQTLSLSPKQLNMSAGSFVISNYRFCSPF